MNDILACAHALAESQAPVDRDSTFMAEIKRHLKNEEAVIRRELLSRPVVWHSLYWTPADKLISSVVLGTTMLLMFVANRRRSGWQDRASNNERGDGWWTLFSRDFAPIAFDVHTHPDHLKSGPYRGLVHWFRDAVEKMLSVAVLLVFVFYLARASSYFWLYIHGESWRLVFLPLDINIALAFAGWALIVDGFIHIGAMIDAPGVSRTMDSLIVILAGFVVMLVEAKPGDATLVSFSVGEPKWLALALAGVVSLLFCARTGVSYWRCRTELLLPSPTRPAGKRHFR